MAIGDSFEHVEVESESALWDWLEEHASSAESRWLVTYKKSDVRYLPYDTIVRTLIAHGWVDSQPRSLDETRSMRLISPRKPGSNWSKANRERAEYLIETGQITAHGRSAVDNARHDGSWTALEGIEAGIVPEDLSIALASRENAAENFNAFPPSSKRIILEWIDNARTEETRRKRVVETAEKAAINERANHYRKPSSSGSRQQ